MTISVNSIPEFSVSGTCDGTDFLLKINQQNNTNNLTYSWYNSLNEKIGSSPIIKIEQKGSYRVDVEDGKCKAVRDVEVNSIYCDIPKGISPNNDQRNDSFDLRNLDVSKLEIFDRYGLKVYSKFDYKNDWDGTSDKGQQLPDGTYYYIVEFKSGKSKTGWVYLNREH
jgi:gliding motility-associated-like protein